MTTMTIVTPMPIADRPAPKIPAAQMDQIQATIARLDHVAHAAETKWGIGRLPLLVAETTRARFSAQRRLLDQAIEAASPVDIVAQAAGMTRAWAALDAEATAAGAQPIAADVWEIRLADGSVARLVKTLAEATAVARDGRAGTVWTLDELARVLSAWPELVRLAKDTFSGATVVDARTKTPMDWINGDELPW